MPQIFLVYKFSNIYFISKFLLLIIIHVKHRWICKHSYLDFWLFLFYTGVQSINNVLVVSGRQQMDSVFHIYVSILSQIPLPHNIEQSSCGPCLSMFNPMSQIFKKLCVSSLTHLHGTQEHDHSLKYLHSYSIILWFKEKYLF